MPGKIALKRLTRSDLTFFEYQHRLLNAGHQKAINLNADVFISRLFPALPETEQGRRGNVPVDIHLLGPGLNGDHRIQRKIIKGGTYKNWRLNGELVPSAETLSRFDPLAEGDFVIFNFAEGVVPTSATLLFVAESVPEDNLFHAILKAHLGAKRMMPLSAPELERLLRSASIPDEHPAHELLLEDVVEDAAMGGLQSLRRLLRRRSGTRMTLETLQNARLNAETIGREGEELVNALLAEQLRSGTIREYVWESAHNAVAPYDFTLVDTTGEKVRLDVKSTAGPFERPLHASMAELEEMASRGVRYDLYRVYSLTENEARLRIASNLSDFATSILDVFGNLPEGVTPDGISIIPTILPFGPERPISPKEDPGE